jgi:hypothetical protein
MGWDQGRARSSQLERVQQARGEAVPPGATVETGDQLAEHHVGEIAVVPLAVGGQDALGRIPVRDRVGGIGSLEGVPHVADRFALDPARVREQLADRRGLAGVQQARIHAVVEVQPPLVAQLHDHRGGEGLRVAGDEKLRVGSERHRRI